MIATSVMVVAGAEVVLEEGREVVLGAWLMKLKAAIEQHEVDKAPQDARLQEDLAEADLVWRARALVASQTSDSSTRRRMKSASSAVSAPTKNSPRQPAIGVTMKNAMAANM